MTAIELNRKFNSLNSEDQNLVVNFIDFLQSRSKNKDLQIFDSMQNEMSKNSPWRDEQEMLNEMAEFRKSRTNS